MAGARDIREIPLKKAWKVLLSLQNEVYRNDPNYVPHLRVDRKNFLNPDKNPFFTHADVKAYGAFKDGKPAGFIYAFEDRDYVEFHSEKVLHFGFFECINDFDVAKALFERVEEFAREKKMEVIRGPFNFSTNHECGLLIDGFDGPPVFLMTYNPPYYKDLIEAQGYSKKMDLLAYWIEARPVPEGLKEAVKRVQERSNITLRHPSLKDFRREIEIVKTIYNDAWSRNWGFVPLREDEFEFIASDLKFVLDPDFVVIAEVNSDPAGFALTLPDFNQVLIHVKGGRLTPLNLLKILYFKRKINRLRVFALGIRKKYQDLGIGALLYLRIWEKALERGYVGAEMSWILETNEPMRRAIEMAGGRIYRTYRIFEKKVT